MSSEPPGAGLLDTSVFIAREDGRPLGDLPDKVAVSAVTIGELQLGLLSAADDAVRARRADTLPSPGLPTDAGLPVVTQDADYEKIAKVHSPLRVMHV